MGLVQHHSQLRSCTVMGRIELNGFAERMFSVAELTCHAGIFTPSEKLLSSLYLDECRNARGSDLG